MAKLIYGVIASLDGYVADEDGKFDWAEPDEEVHTFVNELERSIGTYLYGRRMYEVMLAWEDEQALVDQSPFIREYGEIWRAADKTMYSTTLKRPSSARTRIERDFDPDIVRKLKEGADRDLSVGGPTLAGHALKAGLVEECHFFLAPVVVGSGTEFLPRDTRLSLELVSQDRFDSGMVHLHYRIRK